MANADPAPKEAASKDGADRLTEAVRVLARLTRAVEQACQTGELSLPQYRLLLFVTREPQRAGELASRASVSRPTLTSLIDGLEKQGLVERARVSGDRRGITLELTAEGRRALNLTEEKLRGRVNELVDKAGPEAANLVEAMCAIGEVLDAELVERITRSRSAEAADAAPATEAAPS